MRAMGGTIQSPQSCETITQTVRGGQDCKQEKAASLGLQATQHASRENLLRRDLWLVATLLSQ